MRGELRPGLLLVAALVACGSSDPAPTPTHPGGGAGHAATGGAGGAAQGCTGASDCDDGVVCTLDACDGDVCSHSAAPFGVSCSDGDSCNGDEICDLHGACVEKSEVPCDGYACTAATGCLTTCTLGTDCADGYSCELGVCKMK